MLKAAGSNPAPRTKHKSMTIQYIPIKRIIEKLEDQISIRQKIINDELIGDLYPMIINNEIQKILNAIKKLNKAQ